MATKKKGTGGDKRRAPSRVTRKKKCTITIECKDPLGERLHSVLSTIPELEECYLARGSITITVE